MRQRVEISAAEGQDAAELAALAKQCFPDPWSEGIFRQTLCCCYNRIWCARQNGTLCGYVAVSHTGNAVNLDDIAVHPDFRRQGIGRQLLDFAHGKFPAQEFALPVRGLCAGGLPEAVLPQSGGGRCADDTNRKTKWRRERC